jgi:hypothetical protein
VVDAAEVVMVALGTAQKFTPSMLAKRATTPAEVPALVVTTNVAFGRTVPASKTAGTEVVADFASQRLDRAYARGESVNRYAVRGVESH